MKYSLIFLISAALITQSFTMGLSVYAQTNSTSNANQSSMQNQTAATLTGQPESVLLNKTTIPAEQTTITVNQTSEEIQGQADLQPIGNQTLVEQTPQLSEIENETMIEATGPAVTTIVNKTITPFNQTSLETGQEEELQPQQQQPTGNQSNQTSQQQQQQLNQSSQNQGPIEQIGESLGNLVGG